VLDLAKQQQKGIFIKKALASGHLPTMPGINPIKTNFQFIYQQPAVSSIIVGTITPKHLRQNVLAACLALNAS
jgi:aryl-alcohol dehydrogenase-like predicted oxidoreductase